MSVLLVELRAGAAFVILRPHWAAPAFLVTCAPTCTFVMAWLHAWDILHRPGVSTSCLVTRLGHIVSQDQPAEWIKCTDRVGIEELNPQTGEVSATA